MITYQLSTQETDRLSILLSGTQGVRIDANEDSLVFTIGTIKVVVRKN